MLSPTAWQRRWATGGIGGRDLLEPGRASVNPNYYVTRWGVVAHWKLDEASGTANDSVGTNHLSATNNPVSGTAKVGTASRAFVAASSQYLSITDNAALSTGDVDFWVAGWINLTSKSSTANTLITKGPLTGSGAGEYALYYATTPNRFRFFVENGASFTAVNADTFGAVSTGVWCFICAYHTAASDQIGISVNGGAFDVTACSHGAADTTQALSIGGDTLANRYHNGLIDEVTFGKSPPGGVAGVISEISERLYAGGSGRSYPWV